MPTYKDIGKRIRELRLAKNMTQDELAQLSGYTSRSSINKLELGYTDPSYTKLTAIAAALGISAATLCFPDACCDYTEKERAVINAYRRQPSAQLKVDKTLGLLAGATDGLYSAAHSKTSTPDGFEVERDGLAEHLRSLPETDETLM